MSAINVGAFCPVPKIQKYNFIYGTVERIIVSDPAMKIPLQAVRVWVEGSRHFTVANEEGYFFLNRVENETIVLRFEYLGEMAHLDLGRIGLDKKVEIHGIIINNGVVEYQHISTVNIGLDGE